MSLEYAQLMVSGVTPSAEADSTQQDPVLTDVVRFATGQVRVENPELGDDELSRQVTNYLERVALLLSREFRNDL